MYLTEEKRAEIRKCIEIQQRNSGKNKISNIIKRFHDTEGGRKVSQILFDARVRDHLFRYDLGLWDR